MAHSERNDALRPRTELPTALRQVTVARAVSLSPRMRRLILTGPELAGHMPWGQCPPLASPNFDDHCKLLIPQPGVEVERAAPGQTGAGLPDSLRGRGRHYTISHWDPAAGELWLDVLRHEGGLVGQWAFAAQVGDVAYLGGPRATAAAPHADWYLFVADQAALPAVERWMRQAAPGVRAAAVISVYDVAEVRPLATAADASIDWMVGQAGPGRCNSGLLRAAERAALTLATGGGEGFAWVAGESALASDLRELLEGIVGAGRVEVGRYWSAQR